MHFIGDFTYIIKKAGLIFQHEFGCNICSIIQKIRIFLQNRLLFLKLSLTLCRIKLKPMTVFRCESEAAKYLHGSSSENDFNQQVDYTYNEKGWLRKMNTLGNPGRDLFALDLRYNTPGNSDALTAGARYNGNIS